MTESKLTQHKKVTPVNLYSFKSWLLLSNITHWQWSSHDLVVGATTPRPPPTSVNVILWMQICALKLRKYIPAAYIFGTLSCPKMCFERPRPSSWRGGGSLPPPQESHPCSQPLASIFGHSGLSSPHPTSNLWLHLCLQ